MLCPVNYVAQLMKHNYFSALVFISACPTQPWSTQINLHNTVSHGPWLINLMLCMCVSVRLVLQLQGVSGWTFSSKTALFSFRLYDDVTYSISFPTSDYTCSCHHQQTGVILISNPVLLWNFEIMNYLFIFLITQSSCCNSMASLYSLPAAWIKTVSMYLNSWIKKIK